MAEKNTATLKTCEPQTDIRSMHQQLKERVMAVMNRAAIEANVSINVRGLGIASGDSAFIAGVPVVSPAGAYGSAFVYFDVPELGKCSELLPPDFYLVQVITAPLRGLFTGSTGKRVLVHNVTIEAGPPSKPVSQSFQARIGTTKDTCFPWYNNEVVWIKVDDSDDN